MEKKQRMSIYFPLDLLEQVRQSAKEHRRSFNQEVLSILSREVNKKAFRKLEQEAVDQAIREAEQKLYDDLLEATPEEYQTRPMWKMLRRSWKTLDEAIEYIGRQHKKESE